MPAELDEINEINEGNDRTRPIVVKPNTMAAVALELYEAWRAGVVDVFGEWEQLQPEEQHAWVDVAFRASTLSAQNGGLPFVEAAVEVERDACVEWVREQEGDSVANQLATYRNADAAFERLKAAEST